MSAKKHKRHKKATKKGSDMTPTQEFDLLVSEHIDGKPSRHSTQRLNNILKKDTRLRREFTDQIMMHDLLNQYWDGKPRKRAVLDRKPREIFPPQRESLLDKILKPFRRSKD